MISLPKHLSHMQLITMLTLAVIAGMNCNPAPEEPRSVVGKAELVYSDEPPLWYEGYGATARVGPDGRYAVYGGWLLPDRIIDLRRGAYTAHAMWPGVDSVQNATFGPDGELVLLGSRAGAAGWFARAASKEARRLEIPTDALPTWSPDGAQVAYLRLAAPEPGLVAGPLGQEPKVIVAGQVTGYAWLPDSKSLLALVADSLELSRLVRVDLGHQRHHGRREQVGR